MVEILMKIKIYLIWLVVEFLFFWLIVLCCEKNLEIWSKICVFMLFKSCYWLFMWVFWMSIFCFIVCYNFYFYEDRSFSLVSFEFRVFVIKIFFYLCGYICWIVRFGLFYGMFDIFYFDFYIFIIFSGVSFFFRKYF